MYMFRDTWKLTNFSKIQIQILKKAHLGFLGSFDMLFLVLQANYCEKISLMGIFSLVSPNVPGLLAAAVITVAAAFNTLMLSNKKTFL